VPDSDLFHAINEGRAQVVTDQIKSFVAEGILLESGQLLKADLIVTATGLNLKMLGGIQLEVDGKAVQTNQSMTYKAMMFSDIPNLALCFGYTNASWTLKCDLTSEYICRVLNHMKAKGYRQCVPRIRESTVTEIPFVALKSGYIKRGQHLMPKQGSKAPWRLRENYALDIAQIRYGRVDDGVMEFS
jgi:monooxygenase